MGAYYLTLGPHIGTVRVALPYPTLRSLPPLREEPYAGGRADLLGSPIPCRLLDEDTTTALVEVLHQSCGIGCLRLLRDPSSVV